MSCIVTKGQHTLQDIHDSGEDGMGIRRVVRWCSACGAVVRDIEVDGRLRPGGSMPMQFPRIAALAQKGGQGMNVERLFDQIGHDLGWHDHSMRRDRPYNGQAHTCTGERGATEIKGITFRDLRDCFIRAYALSHCTYVAGSLERIQPNAALADEAMKGEDAAMCESDLYTLQGDIDPMAFCQNLSCEIERAMSIFPNVPPLEVKEVPHGN